MRQLGQTEQDTQFTSVLSNLRVGSVIRDDWQFLQTRVLSSLSPDESKEFDDAMILYTRNKEVDEKNIQMLEATRNPVARLEAQYHGVNASVGRKVDSDDCGNLEDILHLSVGARVLQLS